MRRAERRAARLVLIAAGCAVALLDTGPSGSQVLAAVAVAVTAFGLWRSGWIGSRHRVVELRWLADGGWLVTGTRQETLRGELSPDTRILGNAVWLRWKTAAGRSRSVLLTPGDLPAGQLRALRVRLRTEAPERALPEARAR
jgi:hypothetical protein